MAIVWQIKNSSLINVEEFLLHSSREDFHLGLVSQRDGESSKTDFIFINLYRIQTRPVKLKIIISKTKVNWGKMLKYRFRARPHFISTKNFCHSTTNDYNCEQLTSLTTVSSIYICCFQEYTPYYTERGAICLSFLLLSCIFQSHDRNV